MPEVERRKRAVASASVRAPAPQASSLLYGAIAVALLSLAVAAFGRFYSVDVISFPLLLALGGAAVFAGGYALRNRRARRHRAAVEEDFEANE